MPHVLLSTYGYDANSMPLPKLLFAQQIKSSSQLFSNNQLAANQSLLVSLPHTAPKTFQSLLGPLLHYPACTHSSVSSEELNSGQDPSENSIDEVYPESCRQLPSNCNFWVSVRPRTTDGVEISLIRILPSDF